MTEKPICYLDNQSDVEYPSPKSEYTLRFVLSDSYPISLPIFIVFPYDVTEECGPSQNFFGLEWVFQRPTVFMTFITTNLTVRCRVGKIGLDLNGKSL